MAGPDLAAFIDARLQIHCPECWRPRATEEDWETYGDNEGDHLCWADSADRFGCQWTFKDLTRERRIREALADFTAPVPVAAPDEEGTL